MYHLLHRKAREIGEDSQMIRSKIIMRRIGTMPLLQKSIGVAMGIAAL